MTRQELESFRRYVAAPCDVYPWLSPREMTLNPRFLVNLVDIALGNQRLEDEEATP